MSDEQQNKTEFEHPLISELRQSNALNALIGGLSDSREAAAQFSPTRPVGVYVYPLGGEYGGSLGVEVRAETRQSDAQAKVAKLIEMIMSAHYPYWPIIPLRAGKADDNGQEPLYSLTLIDPTVKINRDVAGEQEAYKLSMATNPPPGPRLNVPPSSLSYTPVAAGVTAVAATEGGARGRSTETETNTDTSRLSDAELLSTTGGGTAADGSAPGDTYPTS